MIRALADPLKVLLIEDSPADVDMVLRELHALDTAIQTQVVANAGNLRQALSSFSPHLVLSDFSMPGFNGIEALGIVRQLAPDTPFIFVSGTIGEEVAIAAMHAGAEDYVLKENLRRLTTSVERALRNAAERGRRRQMERALRESEERFRSIVETTEDWIWEADTEGFIAYSNAGIERILGYRPDEVLGHRVFEFMADGDSARVERMMPEDVATARAWRGRMVRWRHRDGSLRVLESNARPLFDENGEVTGFRGIDRDVTVRVRQEARIRELARIHAVLGALGEAILKARGRQALIEATCRIAVEQGGFATAWIAGRADDGTLALLARHGAGSPLGASHPVPVLTDRDNHAEDARVVAEVFERKRIVTIGDVHGSWLSAKRRAAADAAGVRAVVAIPIGAAPWGALVLYQSEPHDFDADELKLLQRLAATLDFGLEFIAKSERLEYLAYHHPLTGLPNRVAFLDRLAVRMACQPLLVGAIDVLRFHAFNESRGRDFGDLLLRALAERLRRLIAEGGLLAHPGEDTFLFSLPAGPTAEDDHARISATLATCSDTPFIIEGEEVFITLRCGLLRTPEHAEDADSAERNVVAALGEAIARNVPLATYSDEFRDRSHRRIELERELRHAIDSGQFELYLQPKFDAGSQRLSGAEALLRWNHPEHGLVSPGEFIPLLEDTGLIVAAGEWAMRQAIGIVRRWREAARDGLRLAVNVSARELRQHDFVERCAALLADCGSEPCLDIEITESLLMDDIVHSMRILQALRDLGCRIAIDDFGTGYSSLNYLSRLPADTLKIDQSFVAQLAQSPETLSLVTNIINLAHSLGLSVVAEGVEDEEQAKLLRLLRCDELQGYLLGRPVSVEEFERQHLA